MKCFQWFSFLFLGIVMFIFVTPARCQDEMPISNLHQVKATYLGLGYSFEWTLAERWVLNNEIQFSGAFGSSFFMDEGDYWYLVMPSLIFEPRYYYNYHKRITKGKKVVNNSANYFCLTLDNTFPAIIHNKAESIYVLSAIPKWGLKRTIGDNVIFEFAVGVGGLMNKYGMGAMMEIDLNIGYAF